MEYSHFELLPPELLQLILRYLSPRDLQLLQVALKLPLYGLYRRSVGYPMTDNEHESFQLFHESYFFKHMYRQTLHVPSGICRQLRNLQRVHLRGASRGGNLVLAVHDRTIPPREGLDWPIYRSMILHATHGILELNLDEEADISNLLIREGDFRNSPRILAGYIPQTPEMAICQLFFHVETTIDRRLWTQKVCDMWFPTMSADQLNNLPPEVNIFAMLRKNARRFMTLANQATIKKYQLDEPTEWIYHCPSYFPALVYHRKKIGFRLRDLTPYSEIQITTHGMICHLLKHNPILLRSQFFNPGMEVLRLGASKCLSFFHCFVPYLPHLSREDICELQMICQPKRDARPLTPPPVPFLTRMQLLTYLFDHFSVNLVSSPRINF